MALEYDKEMFELIFRPLAITDGSKLEVGKTYWSNSWEGGKVLLKYATYAEMLEFEGRQEPSHETSLRDKMWLIFEDGTVCSADDHNIGSSYNAWLVFDDERYSTICRNMMPVKVIPDDDWDDWNKGWYDDDEWLLSGDDYITSLEVKDA